MEKQINSISTGMTFWDFINKHKKFFAVLIFIILISFILLILTGFIRFGEKGGFFFGKRDKNCDVEEITITHEIDVVSQYGGIAFRAKRDFSLDPEIYIGTLYNGHHLQIENPNEDEKWYHVKTIFNCELKEGWIFKEINKGKYLDSNTIKDIPDYKLEVLLKKKTN